MTRVAILDDYQGVAVEMADWAALPGSPTVRAFTDHLSDEDRVASRLEPFDIIVAMRERTPFPGSLLERLPRLRLLVTTGMRNRAIDTDAAARLGVLVCGTGSLHAPTVELTWALILALARGIPREDRGIRAGRWQVGLGHGIEGKVLGVVGLGRIGADVARIGQAFGMRVVAWSQNLSPGRADEVGVARVTKDELLSRADVVTVHLVLSERTRGLIGARELALMQPTAFLVNTSRGPIVDEGSLVDALRGRRIAGAALDVFDEEPLPPDHPLRQLENTVITPHIGYVTAENYRTYFGQAVEDIRAFLVGAPIRALNAPASTR